MQWLHVEARRCLIHINGKHTAKKQRLWTRMEGTPWPARVCCLTFWPLGSQTSCIWLVDTVHVTRECKMTRTFGISATSWFKGSPTDFFPLWCMWNDLHIGLQSQSKNLVMLYDVQRNDTSCAMPLRPTWDWDLTHPYSYRIATLPKWKLIEKAPYPK